MNIFFIHTPLQLLICQNLIIKKLLDNNVLLISYTGINAVSMLDVYEILLIKDLWAKYIFIGDISKACFSIKKPFKSFFNFFRFNTKVLRVLSNNNPSSLYMGDINHPYYIYIAIRFGNTYPVNFLEEGLSHYSHELNPMQSNIYKIFYSKLLGLFFDLFFNVNGYFKKLKNAKYGCYNFKINKRYSILKFHNALFDENLLFKAYLTKKISDICCEEVHKVNSYPTAIKFLFLSSSTTSEFKRPLEDEYSALEFFLRMLGEVECTCVYKFHPKDPPEKRLYLRKFLESKFNSVHELFDGISLPIEVIFDKFKFDYIVGYDSSSLIYARYIYNCDNVFSLYPYIIEMYRTENDKYFFERNLRNWRRVKYVLENIKIPQQSVMEYSPILND